MQKPGCVPARGELQPGRGGGVGNRVTEEGLSDCAWGRDQRMGKTFQAGGGVEGKHQRADGAGDLCFLRERTSLKDQTESVEFGAAAPAYCLLATVADPRAHTPEEGECQGSAETHLQRSRTAEKGGGRAGTGPGRCWRLADADGRRSRGRRPRVISQSLSRGLGLLNGSTGRLSWCREMCPEEDEL